MNGLTLRCPAEQLQANKDRVALRLNDARLAYQFARDAHEGFPSDLTEHDMREAKIVLEDAIAEAQEWIVHL